MYERWLVNKQTITKTRRMTDENSYFDMNMNPCGFYESSVWRADD